MLQYMEHVLTQQEIQEYMTCPPTGNESGLVGYWNFEEGSGTTALDQTPNGNDGTINGATYDTNVPVQSCALTNANGCDSTAILNLTINQADTSYTNITACDSSYTWNDSTYTQSGTYSYNGGTSSNNYSMSFDGVDDWIEVPTSSSLDNISTELTVSAWINPVNLSNGTHPRIVDRSEGPGGVNDRWLLTWSPTGTVDFGIGSGANGCLGNSVTPLNSWTHIAATFNNGQIYIYINGILDASATSSIISLSHIQNCNLKIGSAPASSFFPGKIENVHLWNTALSQIEIQQYMNCPPTGNESGLVGYWNFEEGSGTTAYDQTPNGNNGTINGATYDTNVPSQSCSFNKC